MRSRKKLFFIAGANGSGKTTLAKELLQEEKGLIFLNADDIAYDIFPNNIEKVKISAARRELYKRLDVLFEKKLSIAIERILSGSNYIKIIDKAKKLNYHGVMCACLK